jgi:hypothetical protein
MRKSILIVALLVPYSAVAIDVFGIVAISLSGACGTWITVKASTKHGYCSTDYILCKNACEEQCQERVEYCGDKLDGCCNPEKRVRCSETVSLVGSQPTSQPVAQPMPTSLVIRPMPVHVGQLEQPAEEFRKVRDLGRAALFKELRGFRVLTESGSESE